MGPKRYGPSAESRSFYSSENQDLSAEISPTYMSEKADINSFVPER